MNNLTTTLLMGNQNGMRKLVSVETRIILPLVTPMITEDFVTWESPKKIRKAVHKIAIYFKREGGFDFTQFGVNDKTDHEVYVFHQPRYSQRSGQWGSEIFGAACFRWRNDWDEISPRWGLQWIWLHPYFRRKGLLKEVWPLFLEKFGNNFIPETPYTHAMIEFLKKNSSREQILSFKELGWSDFLGKYFPNHSS